MNILITRPSPYGEELVNQLLSMGKLAYHLPLIYFSPGKTLSLIKNQLNSLSKGDFLFIVSQHAVKYAHHYLLKLGISWPTSIKYYTIGYKTSLQMYLLSGISSKYPTTEETSEGLLQMPELIHNISGHQALILKGNNGGRDVLEKTLKTRGMSVLCCECYSRNLFQYNGLEKYQILSKLNIKIIVVTTGAMLKQLYYLIPKYYHKIWLLQCQLIVVSTRLANLAYNLGWKHIIISKSANNNSIFNELLKIISNNF